MSRFLKRSLELHRGDTFFLPFFHEVFSIIHSCDLPTTANEGKGGYLRLSLSLLVTCSSPFLLAFLEQTNFLLNPTPSLHPPPTPFLLSTSKPPVPALVVTYYPYPKPNCHPLLVLTNPPTNLH